jgi:hypothetical protein
MTKCLEILRKSAENSENGRNSFPEFVRNFIFHFIFSIHSLLSRGMDSLEGSPLSPQRRIKFLNKSSKKYYKSMKDV